MPRVSRWLFPGTLLTLVFLTFSMLPPTPALAKRVFRPVADLVPEFQPGVLERTSVAPQKSNVANDGRIELAPVAKIDTWNESSFSLPESVTSHAAVELNGRIYVLGGSVLGQSSSAPTDHVWRGTPATNGDLSGAWTAVAPLPAVTAATTPGGTPPCAQTDNPLPGRSSLAAASISTGTSTGFIYAIGGVLDSQDGASARLPTSAVAIGQVAADGSVTWKNGPCLPKLVQSASATIINLQGAAFLYVVGGLEQDFEGNSLESFGVKDTYFARINTTTGDLTKVSDNTAGWTTNADLLPLPAGSPPEAGVWNAALIADTAQTDKVTQPALFLMGGQTIPGQTSDSATVYRGIIDPTSGQVSWNTNSFNATLNTPRRGVRAIQYNGNVMVIGGQQGNTTTFADVLSNQIDDSLNISVPGGTSSFYQSSNVLTRPRYNHAAVVVAVGTDHYVYVLGGQGDNNENSGQATNTLFYGKIDTRPDESIGYATNGWYFSSPFKIDLNNAKLLSIRWDAVISPGLDIAMEYRTNNNPNQTDSSWTPWTSITDPGAGTAKSKNGANTATLSQGANFIFFQYRAFFTTSPSRTETPALNSVSVEVEIPGYPNLQVSNVQPQINAQQLITGLKVQIANRNPLPQGTELQGAEEGSKGTFFVDVFITKGTTATAPKLGQLGQIYAEVDKSVMTPNATFDISSWCETATSTCNYDITKQFSTSGDYTIYVIVDNVENAGTADAQSQPCPDLFSSSTSGQPCGNVIEADSPGINGESDNISGPVTFHSEGPGQPVNPTTTRVLLPIIIRL